MECCRTLDSFILCCYANKSLPALKSCESPGNGFSSCEDMLKNVVIQLVIWIQGVFASLGNLIVIIWWAVNGQQKTKRKRRKFSVQSLLLSNLALADLLMGVYLLIIAVQHTIWRGEYFKHDVEWRSGIKCQVAGAISTLSSEVSVMILVAITTDRANSFLFEFSQRRLSLRLASIICLCIWIIGFIVAFVPLFIPSYFEDTSSGFSFYGRSTVCLPLQLSSERPAGWEYSIAVFNVFNGIAFVYILLAYTAIFIKVQRSAKSVRSSKTSQSSLGKRLAFVILTDFCCWVPVVVLGVLSLTRNFQDPTGEVYAWVAVLVLPINSSINPILYTFSTPQVTKKLQLIKSRWQKRRGNTYTAVLLLLERVLINTHNRTRRRHACRHIVDTSYRYLQLVGNKDSLKHSMNKFLLIFVLASSCSTQDTSRTKCKQGGQELQKTRTTADQSSLISRLRNEVRLA